MKGFSNLRLSKSPFYKKSHHDKYVRGKKSVKVDFKISETAYNDLIRYFKGNGMTKTEGFKQIIWDKLEMINTFQNRRNFNNIEFIMIFPKTDNLEELNKKAVIIALYNTAEDFIDGFHHEEGFDNKFNYQYDLNLFGKTFFEKEMMILNSTKESSVYRVNLGDLEDWDSFYRRLDDLYDLGHERYYFVRCPLNNYLDVKMEGQYQSKDHTRGDHDAIYVFNDFERSLYCQIKWNYSLEMQSIIFEIEFIMMSKFIEILYNSDFKPLRESLGDVQNSEYNKNKIDTLIRGQTAFLEFLKDQREKLD